MRLLANVQKSLHFLYLRDFLSKSCPPKIRQIALMQLFQHKPTKLTFIMGLGKKPGMDTNSFFSFAFCKKIRESIALFRSF